MFYIYIMSNKPQGTLYIGSTDNLDRRVSEHKNKSVEGFTKKYDLSHLVYFEACDTRDQCRIRENQLKKWKRDWKINPIEQFNRHWQDLAGELNNDNRQSQNGPLPAQGQRR